MKNIWKNYLTTKQPQFFTALILTGILSTGSLLTLLKSATAAPTNLLRETANEVLEGSISTGRLLHVDQTQVYHPDGNSVLKLNQKARAIGENNLLVTDNSKINPVPIPKSELPPPLDSGVIFQQISSGGFTGRTYKTVLLDDGRLIRVRIGDANDSERSVRRISQRQLRGFQHLLEENNSEFNNLRYPPSSGAADYITYTLTSRDGTVEYNDISQSSLPENLQVVVLAWNRISNSQ